MKRLRELRKAKDLTLIQLSKEINISYQVLSRYELGERQADYQTVHKIAQYFNVSMDYLLGFSDYFFPDEIKPMVSYSASERELIEQYRTLTPAGKHLIDETLKTLLETSSGSEQKNNKIS